MAEPNTVNSNQKNLRILVAEDNAINQKLIQQILEKAGYGVDLVDNGRQAVEFACQIQYDMIFMDIQMPLMDGYTATRQIRKCECGMRNCNEEGTDSNSEFPIPHSEFRIPNSSPSVICLPKSEGYHEQKWFVEPTPRQAP